MIVCSRQFGESELKDPHLTEVYIDGVRVTECHFADDEKGLIVRKISGIHLELVDKRDGRRFDLPPQPFTVTDRGQVRIVHPDYTTPGATP